MVHFLDDFFHPRTIAVYGASGPLKMGTLQAVAILDAAFPGQLYYLHPSQETVLGQKAYRQISDVPGPVDLALLVIPAKAVPGVIAELGRKGVRRAIVTAGGFAEVGTEEGRRLNEELKSAARAAGLRFIGPNCLGIVNAYLPLNTTTFSARLIPGGISIASHSGSYTTQIFPYLENHEPGLGLRYAISLGNEADIDVVDALDCFREDEKTRVILLYLEGIRRGREFIRAARAASLVKPVVVHYVGGNEAGTRAGASHTAALGVREDLARGLFEQCGLIWASGVEEWFDFSRVLSQAPPMAGRRAAVVTNSGGPGATAAWMLEKCGLTLPRLSAALVDKLRRWLPDTGTLVNPVDFTFDVDLNHFREAVRLLLASGEVDAVLIYGLFLSGFFERRRKSYERFFPELKFEPMFGLIQALVAEAAALPHKMGKPVVMGSLMGTSDDAYRIFAQASTPVYPTPERAARALAALARYWEWRRRNES